MEHLFQSHIKAPRGEHTFEDHLDSHVAFEKSIPDPPEERIFGGLVRGEGGHFADGDLAKLWAEAVEDPAGEHPGRSRQRGANHNITCREQAPSAPTTYPEL